MQTGGKSSFISLAGVVTLGWLLLMFHVALVSAMVFLLSGIVLISSLEFGRHVAQNDLLLLLILAGAILAGIRFAINFASSPNSARILTKPELVVPIWLTTLALAFWRWRREKQSQ